MLLFKGLGHDRVIVINIIDITNYYYSYI